VAGLALAVGVAAWPAFVAAGVSESNGAAEGVVPSSEEFMSSLAAAVPCTSTAVDAPDEIVSARELTPMRLDVPPEVSGLRVVPDDTLQQGTQRAFISGYLFPIPHDVGDGLLATDRVLFSAGPLEGRDVSYVSVAVHVGDPAVVCYAFAHAAVQPMPHTVAAAAPPGSGPDPFAEWVAPAFQKGASPAGALLPLRGRVAYLLPRSNGPGGRINMLAWLENETTLVEIHGEGVTDAVLRAVAERLVVRGDASARES
jgi:hypothetical protein